MFFALANEKWTLQLVVQRASLELGKLAKLPAEYVPVEYSPFSKTARLERKPFQRTLARIQSFQPELIFFAPINPSFLEETLCEAFPEISKGGFKVLSDFWPNEGLKNPHELVKRYSFAIPVGFDEPDCLSLNRAAEFFLGRSVSLKPFRFHKKAPPTVIDSSSPIALCPGSRLGDYFRGWGEGSWIRELALLEKETNQSFLFLGTKSESASNREIFRRLPGQKRHANLTGRHKNLSALCATLSTCQAYVGKDCGMLHLAGALGLPVLGVYGGGHWGRFLPNADRFVVLTSAVPCRGCNWRCHLPEPVCVRGLPEGSLLQGWKALGSLKQGERKIMEFEPSGKMASLIRPAGDYPVRCHEERRAALRVQRELILSQPFSRWLGRFFR